jgi:hypothetical protein
MPGDDAEKLTDAAMQELLVCIYHGWKSSVQSDAILAISAVPDSMKTIFFKETCTLSILCFRIGRKVSEIHGRV